MLVVIIKQGFYCFKITIILCLSGGTDELSAIVDEIKVLFPETKLIGVGFSMGANMLLKYLGEKSSNQRNFIGAFSGCQGYDIES